MEQNLGQTLLKTRSLAIQQLIQTTILKNFWGLIGFSMSRNKSKTNKNILIITYTKLLYRS